jgi:hypothetical protein
MWIGNSIKRRKKNGNKLKIVHVVPKAFLEKQVTVVYMRELEYLDNKMPSNITSGKRILI